MQGTKDFMKSIKGKLFIATVLSSASMAHAALPPQHQNMKDLQAMMSYVSASPAIMSGLQAIDLISKTVFYGDGCTAVFERLVIDKPEGWVGPADPLVIKNDSCPDYDEVDDMGMHDMDDVGSITMRETDECSVDILEASCKP